MSINHVPTRLRSTALLAGFSALFLLGPGGGAHAQATTVQDSSEEGSGETVELSTLTFNAWHGMSMISDGVEATAALIEQSGAELVFLQEIDGQSAEVADLLGFDSHDLGGSAGIISRHPIVETGVVEAPGAQSGWTKAVVEVGGVEVAAYSGHLEYRSYANYLPRGYGGEALGEQWPQSWQSWDRLEEPVTDVEILLEVNDSSARPDAAAALVADVAAEQESGRLALIGGDFNEASDLDWTEEAAELFDRNGVAVPWQTTATLREGGLVDTYRSAFPDPITHPGFTFPSDNLFHEPEDISWAPGVDERDRIDYIFYMPDENMALDAVRMVGPQTSIVKADRVHEDTEDPIFTPEADWPSDHKAVQADFVICGAQCQAQHNDPDEVPGEEPEAEQSAEGSDDERPNEESGGNVEDPAPGGAPAGEPGQEETKPEEEGAPTVTESGGPGERAEKTSGEQNASRGADHEDLAQTGLNTGLVMTGAVALAALIGGTAAVVAPRRRGLKG